MLVTVRLYVFILLGLLCLDTAIPHHEARAWFKKGSTIDAAHACSNTSWTATASWCVAADGWTNLIPKTGTGSCSLGTYTETCAIYISDTGTGTLSTCRVAVDATFDLTTVPSDANTCPLTVTNVSGLRNNSADFLLFKRGSCFYDSDITTNPCTGAANTTTAYGISTSGGSAVSGSFSRNGVSSSKPVVIAAYGPYANARPVFTTAAYVFNTSGVQNGDYMMMMGIEIYDIYKDPNSGYFTTATAAANSGTGATTITVSSALPAYFNAGGATAAWIVFNMSNMTWMRGTLSSTPRVTGLDAPRTTLTLLSALSANQNVSIGDKLAFYPYGATNINQSAQVYNWMRFEDVKLRYVNLTASPFVTPAASPLSFTFRRSVCEYAYQYGARAQCILLGDSFQATSDLTLDESVIDHSGWLQVDNDCVPGQIMPTKCGGVPSPTVQNASGNPPSQNQGAYVHEAAGNANWRNSIFTNGNGSAFQLRPGGTAYNNFTARSQTLQQGGGILNPNVSRYNVNQQAGAGYYAIFKATSATVSGNTITSVDGIPGYIALGTYNVYNLTTGTALNSTVSATTKDTITLGGAAFNVAINDTIAISENNQYGQDYATAYFASNAAGGYSTTAQYNIVSDSIAQIYSGASPAGAHGIAMEASVSRATGNSVSNNYFMNLPTGLLDLTQILGIDGTGCGGQLRVTLQSTNNWQVGDAAVVTGATGISWTTAGSQTVSSKTGTTLCIANTSAVTGTWTANTGVINGGTSFSSNFYSNVTTPSSDSRSTPSSFSPVGTGPGCPQAINCPTIEGYDLYIGGDGTLAHFVNNAKLNRRGNWDVRYTANSANNYIRAKTSASIPLQ